MKYVALLRGINVGGKNKVNMKQLAAAMEREGLQDVSTYINSGNIFFRDGKQSREALRVQLEGIIASEFNLQVRALVIDKPTVDAIANTIPSNWTNDTVMRCDVLFLWEKYNTKEVLEQLPTRPDIDTVLYVKGAVVWSIDRKNVTRSGLAKIIGTDLYAHMTIRNCNTVRKIQELIAK